jgi:Zn-finger nucleic acid-binding protein
MEEHEYEGVTIDRCTHCEGIWFDTNEHKQLKHIPGSEIMDSGDSTVGAYWDLEDEIDCPRCGERMHSGSDPDQPHIWVESCEKHGLFMDAGEFKDYKYKNWIDFLRFLKKGRR